MTDDDARYARIRADVDVFVASRNDATTAAKNALRTLGCTREQLIAMADSGDFESVRHRMAWVAIGDVLRAESPEK